MVLDDCVFEVICFFFLLCAREGTVFSYPDLPSESFVMHEAGLVLKLCERERLK